MKAAAGRRGRPSWHILYRVSTGATVIGAALFALKIESAPASGPDPAGLVMMGPLDGLVDFLAPIAAGALGTAASPYWPSDILFAIGIAAAVAAGAVNVCTRASGTRIWSALGQARRDRAPQARGRMTQADGRWGGDAVEDAAGGGDAQGTPGVRARASSVMGVLLSRRQPPARPQQAPPTRAPFEAEDIPRLPGRDDEAGR